MRKLFFIFSILIGFSAATCAQEDTLAARNRLPRIFLNVDYGKIATLPVDFEDKWEAGIGFRIGKHLYPVIYGGMATLSPENTIKNGSYVSEGWYVRAGLEYFARLDLRNSLILGMRYGISNFSETGTYLITSDLFDDLSGIEIREDVTASWAEIVIGSEMRLGESRFYTGGYFTLRILIDRTEFSPVDTYTIPGYGRTTDKTLPAVQLYLKFALAK